MNYLSIQCKVSWLKIILPVPPLQLWLAHQCLQWSSGSLSSVYWGLVLFALRWGAGLMYFPASADGCVTKAMDCPQSSGCPTVSTRSTGSRLFSGLCSHDLVYSQDKHKGWQQASLPHLCLNLKLLCQLPLMNHSARQTLIRVPIQIDELYGYTTMLKRLP